MKTPFVKTMLSALIVGAGLAAGGVSGVHADEPIPGIKMGDYRELTFMRSIKLGTAPYVNPELVKNSAVVYYYNPVALKGIGIEEWLRAYKAGFIGIATAAAGEFHIQTLDKSKAIELLGGEDGYVIVSGTKNLFDAKPEGQLVTWDAGETVKPQF